MNTTVTRRLVVGWTPDPDRSASSLPTELFEELELEIDDEGFADACDRVDADGSGMIAFNEVTTCGTTPCSSERCVTLACAAAAATAAAVTGRLTLRTLFLSSVSSLPRARATARPARTDEKLHSSRSRLENEMEEEEEDHHHHHRHHYRTINRACAYAHTES